MRVSLERILLVENDPEISDLINRQSLQPLGYQVSQVEGASEAIQEAIHFNPELIIADLNLPDMSGKDLLVALSSQGIDAPVIVLANEGMESDIIQAFRLGAIDYVSWPAREAEIVAAVERVLKQVRAKRESERLSKELDKTNQELERRLKELTTILAIGKTVTSTKRQNELFKMVLEGAVYVTEADLGWLLIRDDLSEQFVMRAQKNLPKSLGVKLNQVWDGSLSSLVALSKESLEIHGKPLKRFKVAQFGQAALVVPLKVSEEVIGLLVVMRTAPQPFSQNNQALLEAVVDYASISLVNVKLFQVLEDRARSLEKTTEAAKVSENEKEALLRIMNQEVRGGMMVAVGYIGMLVDGQMGPLDKEQLDALVLSQNKLKEVVGILERQSPEKTDDSAKAVD